MKIYKKNIDKLKNKKVLKFKTTFTNITGITKPVKFNKKQIATINKQYKDAAVYAKQAIANLKTAYPSFWLTLYINDLKLYHRQTLNL